MYSYSKVHAYDDFSACARAIKQDIRDKDPVIAFFFFEPTKWHYANVVAIKEDSRGEVSEFIMLDTSRTNQKKYFETIRRNNMDYLMYNRYKAYTALAMWNSPGYDYYIIRFLRKK